ncbi:MAG: hypothetical protein K0S47_1450 [Herbinix sp.]|jgi:hypothetical protein|nr:hypothetical protein [Herbinix sp.]
MLFDPRLPHYTGKIHPNCDYFHGQIYPAKGVKCYQVARANRGNKELDDHTGFTYKHAPDLAYFKGKFYVQYLCNPEDEHYGEGISVLASSTDGRIWEDYQISFPPYCIKACTTTDYKGLTHSFDGSTYAFMHQRMSFFQSSQGRMLILGFYGWSPEKWMTNWDNYGIGRVVRELMPDGSLSDIYFIRINQQAGWKQEDLNYPIYLDCKDTGFVAACEELLHNKLYVQQWAEENGDIDELIQIKHPKNGSKNEAFCWYHINQDTLIGLWKHSKVSRSDDNGVSWMPVTKSPSLVMSGQKVWGCKTSDQRFAMIYDPTLETQHRYPLCVTTSEDGLAFDHMLLVHGDVPPMRYKGFWKDIGPQYMRGITEGMELPDKNLWITYSVNKEDIWIAEIPVPITGEERDDFEECFEDPKVLENWNLYCPKWARAGLITEQSKSFLHIEDGEPYDYCKVERIFGKGAKKEISFIIVPNQEDKGCLFIELWNDTAQTAVRLIFRENGYLYARTVTELSVMKYQMNTAYHIKISLDCERFSYQIAVNNQMICDNDGNPRDWSFMMAVNDVSRFILRTGPMRQQSMLDVNPDNLPVEPLSDCELPLTPVSYDLHYFSVRELQS